MPPALSMAHRRAQQQLVTQADLDDQLPLLQKLNEAKAAVDVLFGDLKGADVDQAAKTTALILVSFCTFCILCIICRCLCCCRRAFHERRRTRAGRLWAAACASLDNTRAGESCELGTARLRPSYCNEHGEVVIG